MSVLPTNSVKLSNSDTVAVSNDLKNLKNRSESGYRRSLRTSKYSKNKSPKTGKSRPTLFFWNRTKSIFDQDMSYQKLQEEIYGKSYQPDSAKTKMQPYYNKLNLLKTHGTAKMVEQGLDNNNSWWSFKFLKKFLSE